MAATTTKRARTILITGATTGIGRHAALHLARLGHAVIATGRSEKALASLADEAKGTTLTTLRLDVTDQASIDAAAREVDRATDGRGVDVLVNNAGYGHAGALEEVTDAELRAQFDTNVFGLMAVTRAFLPKMRARGEGRVVNISSVGGRFTFPLGGAYHASKYAVEALSDALRREVAAFGIKVVLIEPGPIATEFSNRTFDTVAKHVGEASSPYAAAYAKAEAIKAVADKQSAPAIVVSRAIARAVEARRPSARYVVPRKLAFVFAILNSMPTAFIDWLMGKLSGLTRENLLPAKKDTRALPAHEVAS